MRVTVLLRSLDRGGAERQGLTLAAALRTQGHDTSIVTFHGGGPLEAEAHRLAVPVESVDRRGRLGAVTFLPRVIRAVRRTKPDVVCSYLGGPNVVAAVSRPFLRGAKVVWGIRSAELDFRHEHPRARLVARAEPLLSRLASGFIANSHVGARDYGRFGFRTARMTVIPNGIDVDRFKPDPAAAKEWRTTIGLPPPVPVIGRVGRMHPLKAIDEAVLATAKVHERGVKAHLVSIGEGSTESIDRLAQLADSVGLAGYVHLLLATDELCGPYSAFDVVVSSSISEGFPNVVAEAMACGTPCVVTDVGDSALVVGETGIVVPPHDPGALADALLELLNASDDDRDRRSKAVRHRVESEFSMESLATRTREFLDSVLEHG